MAALNHATSILFAIGATAATYLFMHMVVAPRLVTPVPIVDVPQLQGLSVDQARDLCSPKGLLLVIDGEKVPVESRIQPGMLFDQHPLSGSRLRQGEQVHVSLAKAPERVRIPSLVNQPLDMAKKRLKDLGMDVPTITEITSPTVPVGQVIRTEPDAGAEVERKATVEIIVSKGADQIAVPNLRGQGLKSALKALEAAGLSVGLSRKGSDDNLDEGVILRQVPPAGTLVPKTQKVDIWVNE